MQRSQSGEERPGPQCIPGSSSICFRSCRVTQRIEELNRLDRALHQEAQKLFDKIVAEQKASRARCVQAGCSRSLGCAMRRAMELIPSGSAPGVTHGRLSRKALLTSLRSRPRSDRASGSIPRTLELPQAETASP